MFDQCTAYSVTTTRGNNRRHEKQRRDPPSEGRRLAASTHRLKGAQVIWQCVYVRQYRHCGPVWTCGFPVDFQWICGFGDLRISARDGHNCVSVQRQHAKQAKQDQGACAENDITWHNQRRATSPGAFIP